MQTVTVANDRLEAGNNQHKLYPQIEKSIYFYQFLPKQILFILVVPQKWKWCSVVVSAFFVYPVPSNLFICFTLLPLIVFLLSVWRRFRKEKTKRKEKEKRKVYRLPSDGNCLLSHERTFKLTRPVSLFSLSHIPQTELYEVREKMKTDNNKIRKQNERKCVPEQQNLDANTRYIRKL